METPLYLIFFLKKYFSTNSTIIEICENVFKLRIRNWAMHIFI